MPFSSLSPAYLPKPSDFPDQARVVGYFWLPEQPFTPPEDIKQFLEKGAPVYVGFGSVNVPGSKTLIVRLVQVWCMLQCSQQQQTNEAASIHHAHACFIPVKLASAIFFGGQQSTL